MFNNSERLGTLQRRKPLGDFKKLRINNSCFPKSVKKVFAKRWTWNRMKLRNKALSECCVKDTLRVQGLRDKILFYV